MSSSGARTLTATSRRRARRRVSTGRQRAAVAALFTRTSTAPSALERASAIDAGASGSRKVADDHDRVVLEPARDLLQFGFAPPGERHPGTGAVQRSSRRGTDATRRARHQGTSTIERERIHAPKNATRSGASSADCCGAERERRRDLVRVHEVDVARGEPAGAHLHRGAGRRAARRSTARDPPGAFVATPSSTGIPHRDDQRACRARRRDRDAWPLPLTPPSMHLRSRIGCGANSPGTVGARGRRGGAPARPPRA